jgi:Secretion system C-terminal sorting domain
MLRDFFHYLNRFFMRLPVCLKLMCCTALLSFAFLTGNGKSLPASLSIAPDTIFPIGILPVRLEYFEVRLAGPGQAYLTWRTAEQWSHIRYNIERAADNYNFSVTGTLVPPDSTSVNRTYEFRDDIRPVSAARVLFYRLQQLTDDGKATYSFIVALRIKDGGGVAVKIWPNPFAQRIQLNFYADTKGEANVKIYDQQGRLAVDNSFTAEKGSNFYPVIQSEKLPPGNYFLQVWLNGEMIGTERLVKKNN